MSGSHYAPDPTPQAPDGDDYTWVHALSPHLTPPNEATIYDLTTVSPHELVARCDRMQEAIDYLTRRVDELEAERRTFRRALEQQADALQVLLLKAGA